jgi:hypothetical protein
MLLTKDFVLRKIGDEFLLIPLGKRLVSTSKIIVLNSTSSYIIEQLRETCDYNDLLDLILNKFDVEPEIAKTDLKRFLYEAHQIGLISCKTQELEF